MQYIRVLRLKDRKEVEHHNVDAEKHLRVHYIVADIKRRLARDRPGESFAVEIIGDNQTPSGADPMNRGDESKMEVPTDMVLRDEQEKWRKRKG